MNKKTLLFTAQSGLTLTELIVVVIILAVLAGIAYPRFERTVESVNGREARVGLELIFAREQMLLAETGQFIFCGVTFDDCNLQLGINLKTDKWNYAVFSDRGPAFLAVAERTDGIYKGFWIWVDDSGQWVSTWPLPY